MLSDRHIRLLSESIDRMLTPRERKQLARLLARDEKARELLEQFKQDSRDIYEMQRLNVPDDLRDRILHIIEERKLRRVAEQTPARRAFPSWARVAVAAAVLIVVSLSTFLYFRPAVPAPMAQETPKQRDTPKQLDKEKPRPPFDPYVLASKDAFVVPVQQPQQLIQALTKQLGADRAHHLSVQTKQPAESLQHLVQTIERQKIRILQASTDPKAASEAKHWLVVLSNLKSADVALILAALAFEPGSDKDRGLVTRVQHAPLAKPMSDRIAKDFRLKLVRIDMPTMLRVDGPGNGVLQAAAQPTQKAEKQAPAEPFAIVLAYTPGAKTHPAIARDIQDFLSKQQHQFGTVQVVLIVHQA